MIAVRMMLALLVGVMLAAAAGGSIADAPAANASGLLVSIETHDGQSFEANCLTPTVRVEVDYGIIDFDVAKLREVIIQPDGERLKTIVMLKDKSHIPGTLKTGEIRFTDRTLNSKDIRALKVLYKADVSLLTIIFGLLTLTVMEIVLGIDNIIFLAIVAGRLPPAQQPKARRIGLVAALVTRLGLLFTLSFILGLTRPVISLPIPFLGHEGMELSWRDIILLVGGGFLIVKSVRELHHKMEESRSDSRRLRVPAGFVKTILLIAVIDIVFSLDSVITAVGMVDTLWVMVTAMVLAMGVMLLFAEPVSRFVDRHPTVKVLALSFLILIGVLLVAEGMGQHIEKGYVYFAMAFAVVIEFINMSLRPKMLAEAVSDG